MPSECSDSNTSHVIVYHFRSPILPNVSSIQIHLMLLFICKVEDVRRSEIAFKYISCYCLSNKSDTKTQAQNQFKYISCYCLSAVTFVAVWQESYSNTSHVIVYLTSSSLSAPSTIIQIHLMLLFIHADGQRPSYGQIFKYISCYCLSVRAIVQAGSCAYSNTSHVIVYPGYPEHVGIVEADSNTSHVIVYRNIQCITDLTRKIQIHLMLLFILLIRHFWTFSPSFKYISCYCLSLPLPSLKKKGPIQIHLMLLFISMYSRTFRKT